MVTPLTLCLNHTMYQIGLTDKGTSKQPKWYILDGGEDIKQWKTSSMSVPL